MVVVAVDVGLVGSVFELYTVEEPDVQGREVDAACILAVTIGCVQA